MKSAGESIVPTDGRVAREVDLVESEADSSTRDRVEQSIMEHGPSTAGELAERLGLTPAAIRRHLTLLIERGLITSREQRVYGSRGRGRPAKVFVLTDQGRGGFPQAYDDLAIRALAALAEAQGDAGLDTVARSRLSMVEEHFRARLADDPETNPVEVLAEALSADGYVASTRPAHAGEQLCQHHCPVAHVAERFPQLCEAETNMFYRLLGVPVQRLATIAHGDGVCTTHVPHARTSKTPSGKTPSTTPGHPRKKA